MEASTVDIGASLTEAVAHSNGQDVTAVAPGDVSVVHEPADLADQVVRRRFSLVAEERLLALMHDTTMLAKAGRAMALLSHIITRCGDGDECVINLHESAQAIGQPYSTVKTWLTALEAAGVITKSSHGRDGVTASINTAHVRRLPVFAQMGEAFRAAATMLQAVQTTVTGALEHATGQIQKWGEVLAC